MESPGLRDRLVKLQTTYPGLTPDYVAKEINWPVKMVETFFKSGRYIDRKFYNRIWDMVDGFERKKTSRLSRYNEYLGANGGTETPPTYTEHPAYTKADMDTAIVVLNNYFKQEGIKATITYQMAPRTVELGSEITQQQS